MTNKYLHGPLRGDHRSGAILGAGTPPVNLPAVDPKSGRLPTTGHFHMLRDVLHVCDAIGEIAKSCPYAGGLTGRLAEANSQLSAHVAEQAQALCLQEVELWRIFNAHGTDIRGAWATYILVRCLNNQEGTK